MKRRDLLRAFKGGMMIGLGGWWLEPPKPSGQKVRMFKDGFLWIEAADFTDFGGWFLDTQFVNLMGSAYLLAKGAGKPVKDAWVEFDLPSEGVYRLWVRCRNWLPEFSPGQFQVLLDGKPLEPILGTAPTDEWIWQSLGEFRLSKGQHRIALHDLTGYYARCSHLLLTNDMNYQPPAKVEEIWRERERLKFGSQQLKDGGEFDVIVVGGGVAGCCAAIAAARLGAKTLLLHDRPVLGGNASMELGVHPEGAGGHHPNARETGIVEEMRLWSNRLKSGSLMSEPLKLLTEAEKNLTVLMEQRVIGVKMADEKTIESVRAMHTRTGEVTVFRGRIFIDCTGDGWLGYYAGAEYRLGREAKDEFGEDLAPDAPDSITMSGCLMDRGWISFRAEKRDHPVPFTPPPWAAKLPPPEKFGRSIQRVTTGQWWIEHSGDIDDLWGAEKARDELIRIAFGYWDFLKNRWQGKEQAANYDLVDVFVMLAKRETRRLIGDYILTQRDVQNGTIFPDRVAYGGWPIDVHHPKGIFSGLEGPFHCNVPVPIYTIPFRCLYSVNIDNLLFAGRDISVTHIALGTVRVQATLGNLGQAVGTAATLCIRKGVTPRELGQKHITELQQTLLKHDQYIPALRNEDPNDLAKRAKVTASSTAEYVVFDRRNVREGTAHPLNMPRAVMFPVEVGEKIESISLLLLSERSEPTEVMLYLRESERSGDFASKEDILSVKAVVPPKQRAWVEFQINWQVRKPFLWVWLPKVDGIFWFLMETAPKGSCRAYGGDRHWTVVGGQYYAFFTKPPIRLKADYKPENVINGIARMTEESSNLWVSDPNQPLPQWLELEWDEPIEANAVYLAFDTNLNSKWPTFPVVPECVRDYELSYHDGNQWHLLEKVTGNFLRWRVHRFETRKMKKLKLSVLATNGDKSARVFEIRVYRER